MFAKKNSLTLAVLWILLLLVGSFWYVKDTHKLVAALDEESKTKALLTQSQHEIKRLTEVQTTHERLKEKWLNASKIIVSADEPSFTLSYVNWIMSTNNLIIDFDFVLNQKKQMGDHTEFIYTLSGEGSYNDIHNLIWHLTYGPILYQINVLDLKKNDYDSDNLRFSVKLQGYTVDSQSNLNDDFDFRDNGRKQVTVQRDVFEPLVKPKTVLVRKSKPKKPKLPEKQPGQIDVEKATIKAITNNSVFMSEGRSGLVEIKIGDPVYLGNLVNIDHEANKAMFLITKFGKTQQVTLGIDQRN